MPTTPSLRGLFRTDTRARAAYSEGAGIHRIAPIAVAVPAEVADLQTLIRWSHDEGIPLVPRGAGSSMAGAAVGTGVVVDLTRLVPRTLLVNPNSRTARTAGAVTVAELNALAATHGLRMPVEPSSARWATLGGMVGTNAAGARSLRYGSVRRWVESLKVVTADAEIADIARGKRSSDPATRRFEEGPAPAIRNNADAVSAAFPRTRKNASGYALDAWLESGEVVDLLVGSEGTLVLTTEIGWRLEPIPPHRSAVRVALTDLEQLGEVVKALMILDPSALELLDRTFLDLVRQHRGAGALPDLPATADAVLIVEFERDDATAAREAAATAVEVVAPWSREVATALTEEEEERIWHLRHAASPILAGLSERRRSVQVIEDGCVPVAQLGRYIGMIRTAALVQGLQVVIFGHAGDGNVHVNVLPDLDRPDWRDRIDALFRMVNTAVVELGGTVSGEHGVGRLRAGFLEQQYGSVVTGLFRQIKSAFDPAGVLNPGVIIPDGVEPLTRLKFEPGAEPLPPDVAQALRTIEREGGYARSRLAIADQTKDPQPSAS
ncbi:MAG TPA: FAD-binding oxidoreductase [Gemmatimonadales bacterium]|nr:FAD-binding oxidoreductase [Gemmatimonadales bacterium]